MKIESSEIIIRDLRLRARIGVSEQERSVGNDFSVSVRLEFHALDAMIHDRLYSTVNYASVIECVKDAMSRPMQLIEHAAYEIARLIEMRFNHVTNGEVFVEKLQPPVSAEIQSAAFRLTWSTDR